jgi:hypothetical protein
MEIIMLLGKRDKGKTTTLHMVYDSIDPDQKDIIEPKKLLGNPKKVPNDFECIIRYKDKDKLSIAFYTMGDFPKKLTKVFEGYNNKKCGCLICACNDLQFKIPDNYPHIIIDKTVADSKAQADFYIANKADSKKIINKINEIINSEL